MERRRTLARTFSVACEAGGMLVEPLETGTAYDLEVRARSGWRATGKAAIVSVPSTVRERTLEQRTGISDLTQWDISVAYSREARGWAFSVSVERPESTPRFSASIEVEWFNDGHRMSRVGRESPFIYHSVSPDPIPFRIRWVNAQGALSPWSNTRFGGVLPDPPYGVGYRQRDSKLFVTWRTGSYWGAALGYRAYLHQEGAPLQPSTPASLDRRNSNSIPGRRSMPCTSAPIATNSGRASGDASTLI